MDNYKERVLNLIEKRCIDGRSNVDDKNTQVRNGSIVSKRSHSLIEYEIKLLSFIAALNSYKSDSLLRPFPNQFLVGDKKDFDRLIKVSKEIPCLIDVTANTQMSNEGWQLLYWILKFNSIELKLLDEQEVKELYKRLKLNNESTVKLCPNYVFKINSPSARTRHNRLKDENGSFQAYHGTNFFSLFSILNNGLINNLNKRDAFGSGTYLSKNLEVAVTFSPYSFIQSNCSIKRTSCILLCDVVEHSSVILKENSSYCLVKDDDLVNVTHVFIYGQMEKNRSKKSFSKYELILFFIGIFVVIYSVYKSNRR